MARSTKKPKDALPSKPKTTDVTTDDSAVSAGTDNGTSDAASSVNDDATKDDAPVDATNVEEAIILGGDPVADDTAPKPGDAVDDASPENATPQDAIPDDVVHPTTEPDVTPADPDTVVAIVPAAEATRGSGFVPLLLGGVLAGAIGFAAAVFLLPRPEAPVLETERLDALAAELDALKAADAPSATDIGPIEAAQAALTERLDILTARVEQIEARPAATPDATAAASAAENGIDDLRAELTELSSTSQTLGEDILTLRGDLEPRVAAVEAGLSEANTLAASVEDQADALARESARNQVRLALQSGAPYAEPLAVLGDAPAPLADAAETGVAAQADLIADFPDLSRAALRTARSATEPAGVGSLFRNAFNPRSLEPREGDDPDAVLSRAEAAVREGDLQAALTEIETLPDDAQAVLQDWTTRARARALALAAADDYLQDG